MLHFKLHSLKWKICDLFKNWNKKWIEWNCVCLKLKLKYFEYFNNWAERWFVPLLRLMGRKKNWKESGFQRIYTPTVFRNPSLPPPGRFLSGFTSNAILSSNLFFLEKQIEFASKINWIIFSSFELRWIVLVWNLLNQITIF